MKHQSLQQNNEKGKGRRRGAKRIEPMAVLPVFYKLAGKKVVLAGGSDAAAWKGELLAASGAIVHVYAEELDEAFDKIRDGEFGAQFVFHKRIWATDIFENATLAISDAESEGEAQAFYCAAVAAGVAVNVIDMPKYCQFQFGSIVNRSPAIISISTDGAAPILGQAIRRKVETLLPDYVSDWAKLAANMRDFVNSKLEMGPQRRKFWEVFVDKAFASAPDKQAKEDLRQVVENISPQSRTQPTLAENNDGSVTLVGAGPGDAELLTLKAVRALQGADVILFDDLVSDEVLELARREAKRMLVGKRGGRESCKQEDINNMMVNFAKAGKNVVRLKSGDPVIFGRAGEEIARLEEENISVKIIPGITSASAMAAQLGVSLTHRDHAQSVRFVTGHSKKGKLPTDIDWRAITDKTASTIFYMGGRTAIEISESLISRGMDPQTPVVICSSVSRAHSKKWQGPLADMAQGIAEIGYDEPVLIGVGSVFEERRISASIDNQNQIAV